MIVKVSDINIEDAAKIYMFSWKESHKEISSEEFIEKHDISYMINYLMGIVGINPKDEEICLLYVSPEQQRKGYGEILLNFAIDKCKNPYITVLDTNKNAIDFYIKRGFVPDNNQPEISAEKHIFERKYVYQNKNM